jgi:serine/threonine protein kinase
VDHEHGRIYWDQIFLSSVGERHWFSEYNHQKDRVLKIPGKRAYVAPEVLNYGKDALSAASDIWTVGCIGAEIITRRPLFETPEILDAFVHYNRIDTAQLDLLRGQGELIHIIDNCVKVGPIDRRSVFDIRAMLEQMRQRYSP